MSFEEADRFVGAVREDPVLRSALESADVHDRGQALLALARAHGFEFTIEEFRERVSAAEAELPDRQLDQVAGGGGALNGLLLQDLLEKRQSAIQTLSNISKSLHDTSTAIIQNLR